MSYLRTSLAPVKGRARKKNGQNKVMF